MRTTKFPRLEAQTESPSATIEEVTIQLLSDKTDALMGTLHVPRKEYMGVMSPDAFSIRMSRKTAAFILRNASEHN